MGSKALVQDHVVEQKTRRRPGRVPTSCAECRRLKLRCDRKVPCESCRKRGCATICPDGSLTSGKGNRMVLANTQELHDRIEHLCSRIRDLEEALKIVQSKVSHEPHPLLATDSLPVNEPAIVSNDVHRDFSITSSVSIKAEEDSFIDAFGTLTVGPSGETAFLGKTARTEYLINVNRSHGLHGIRLNVFQAPSKALPTSAFNFPRLSQRILTAALPASDTAFIDEELGREVFSFLPPLAEAIRLCELYLEHGKYAWDPMSREELFDDCLTVVYRAESFDGLKSVHYLSLLYIVFALATLQDPVHPPYSAEAHEYYILAWLSFQFTPVTHQVTLVSVQASLHIALYLELSDWELKGSSKALVHIGLAVNYGHMIGLHLDSARWSLPHICIERRSRVFWQLSYLDAWLSFSFGRPPNVYPAYVDCGFPSDLDEVINDDGRKEIGFHPWTWKYTILMHSVMATAFGAKIPPYSTILEIDRRIRDFPVPQYLRPGGDKTGRVPVPPTLAVQRWCVLSCKESVLLNLHRGFFAQALHDQPDDILRHKYTPSVIAAYRSAWRLIEGLGMTVRDASQQIARISLVWSHALSAAIVMCLLVTRAPGSNLANSSMEELDVIYRLFEEAAPSCPPAAHNLDSVKKLHRKAHEAVNNSHSQETTSLTPAELDRLGGKTHLIQEDTHDENFFPPPPSDPNSSSPSSGRYSFESIPESVVLGHESIDYIHPTLVQDMKVFDGVDPSNFNDLFDFPPDSFPQSMPDVQPTDLGVPGGHVFSGSMGNNIQPTQEALYTQNSDYDPAPVPDATWQHFMEQLGF